MRARTAAATVAALASLALLAACGDGGPHGTVTEKEHKPGHYECVKKTAKPKSGSSSKPKSGSKTGGSKPKSPKVRTGRGRAAVVPHLLCTGGKTKRWVKPCWQIELNDDAHELCIREDQWDAVKVGDKW